MADKMASPDPKELLHTIIEGLGLKSFPGASAGVGAMDDFFTVPLQ